MTMNNSTYSLLVRSEEKSRTILEIVLFTLVILSAVASIWQFAHQRVILPESSKADYVASVTVAQSARS